MTFFNEIQTLNNLVYNMSSDNTVPIHLSLYRPTWNNFIKHTNWSQLTLIT